MKPLLIDLDYTLTDSFMIKEINAPYFNNTHHFHKDYEIVLVKESSGKRIIGDHVESFSDGDLVLVGPDLPHAWLNEKEYYEGRNDLHARSAVIYLRKTWLENEILRLPQTVRLRKLLENARRGVKFTGGVRERMGRLASEIYFAEGLKKTVSLFSILYELSETEEYQLLSSSNYLNMYNEQETVRLNHVYEYVMKNFSTQIRLEEAASVANMSPNAFCRYFKKQTQKNFFWFVNEIRIGHACKLLQQNELNISQVCYESGFQSLTNFNKFFKRITGKSPLVYRRDTAS
ncbi:HTH-type transcriptional activator RhaR [Dyadobacter sp. CECT 9275]|uniref:HTH-type transcriptional activator RhaR n=1 Tax=Dyadobacter helix TaxID=2822344 RepID=A0A916JFT1_9BACT|nr:AraC family transcriptional regulator [Dyadobacter sp. CECT 9275]CAG5010672.1 HTH-type transcriptional activator RhaR [Dyadobacter sp. CECT 9275]